MKISLNVNNLNFHASILRPLKSNIEKGSGCEHSTREEMVNFYDKQINSLQLQKKQYLELDDFMHSDEIKKLVQELPFEDEIQIIRHCCKDNMPKLMYMTENSSRIKDMERYQRNNLEYQDLIEITPFDRNHNLNKKGIKIWLLNLMCAIFQEN